MSATLHQLPAELSGLIHDFLGWRRATGTAIVVERLTGDGSARIYYRVRCPRARSFIAVDAAALAALSQPVPPAPAPGAADQNQAFHRIREHLENLGFAVPAALGRTHSGAYYLLQDLGDETVFSRLRKQGWNEGCRRLYEDIILLLIGLQTRATQGFSPEFCADGAFYDRALIRTREIDYFLREFVEGLLGLRPEAPAALTTEFDLLLDQAGETGQQLFLYRDFQSRNLMLSEQRIYLIDFQGARLGPGYYDLASLLNDSYTVMPAALKEHLLRLYHQELGNLVRLPPWADFYDQFQLFALFRILQNLGAFAYLSRMGKKQFLIHIPAALSTLKRLLIGLGARRRLPALENLATACCRKAAASGLTAGAEP